MANFVLVHGGNVSTDTWNKLTKGKDYPSAEELGGKIWTPIVQDLRSLQQVVYAPTLSNEYKHNLSDHIQEICRLITANNLNNVILVAHSYGGMIITAVAARMPERIKCLGYIDAALAESGQSLFDVLIQAGLNPADVIAGTPMAYIEKIKYDPSQIKNIPKHFLLCTKSDFISVTRLVKKKINLANNEWTYQELATSHLPMATMPDELVEWLVQCSLRQA